MVALYDKYRLKIKTKWSSNYFLRQRNRKTKNHCRKTYFAKTLKSKFLIGKTTAYYMIYSRKVN